MTALGIYLDEKFIKRADLARKTGIKYNRLDDLSKKANASLKVTELYLIAKALKVDPMEIINIVCANLDLPDSQN